MNFLPTESLFICSIIFQVTFCSKHNVLPSRFLIPESIRVQFPGYEEKVLSCTLEVRFLSSDKLSIFFKLYDEYSLFYRNDMFKYVGKDDNTCSFEILAYKLPEYFSYENGSALTEEWVVYERHVDGGSWYKKLKSKLGASRPDERQYNFHLNPQTFGERVKMAMSRHEITRHAPYNNETITIITQPRRFIIRKCILIISSKQWNPMEIVLYNMNLSYASAESGFEFIGAEDNSCSFRIFIDTLKKRDEKYFDIGWRIREEYLKKLTHKSIKRKEQRVTNYYSFFMHPRLWWQDNMKSKLFLHDGLFINTVEEYF